MTHGIFDTRAKAFETKFKHEAELDFQTRTKGGALFGRWVASLLELNDIESQRYANRLIESIVQGEAPDLMLDRVANDLEIVGKAMSPRLLKAQIAVCEQTARQSLYN